MNKIENCTAESGIPIMLSSVQTSQINANNQIIPRTFPFLVSILIPCYNAERWIAAAIQSCLAQTYEPIEIIVIDDGSTDRSLQILQSFTPCIRIESGPNNGPNAARNRAFALSRGAYIQYLDADDYLLPDKIARQVVFLECTSAQVVYGDWKYRWHREDDYIDEPQISGDQQDILESLLADWWVAPGAVLYRREVIEQSGGWDPTLRAATDRDFMTSLALAGITIRYQPGCQFIYRKYGPVTLSTSNFDRWLNCQCRVLQKAESLLSATGRLTDKYRAALARSYFRLASRCFFKDRTQFSKLLSRVSEIYPSFAAQNEIFQRWLASASNSRFSSTGRL